MSTSLDDLRPTLLSAQQQHYEEHGYVIIPSLVPPDDRPVLLDAARRVVDKVEDGKWEYKVETYGKERRPLGKETARIERLLDPKLGEDVFAKWYGSKPLREAGCMLLQCREDELQLEYVDLEPSSKDKTAVQAWHSDELGKDFRMRFEEGTEKIRVGINPYGLEWVTALTTDTSMWVVVGSHKNELARRESVIAAFSGALSRLDPEKISGARRIQLTIGDTMFFNSNLVYGSERPSGQECMTLHGYVGDARAGRARLRETIFRDQEWVASDEVGKMMERLDKEEGYAGGAVGPRKKMWSNFKDALVLRDQLRREAIEKGETEVLY